MITRHIEKILTSDDYGRQMRFLAGPRQTGKTTITQKLVAKELYFNWDIKTVKDHYRNDPYFFETNIYDTPGKPWVAHDEIHKMPKWKNILKDYFDKFEGQARFIISGSARLDLFRKSGDSLAGRYFLFKLYPLTLSEAVGTTPILPDASINALDFIDKQFSRLTYHQDALEQLLAFSGFPEPFLKANTRFYNRWSNALIDRLIREDVRDLTRIIELQNIETLAGLLPQRIGSPFSLNSVREEMSVSYNAVKNAVAAAELVYMIFMVPPYSKKISRTLKKEKKCYFFNWMLAADEAARFENYVAIELTSLTEFWNDSGTGTYRLFFIRTKDGKESDFLITQNSNPWCLFEVKLKDGPIEKHHYKHAGHLGGIPIVVLCKENKVLKKGDNNSFRVSASRFF